MADIKSIFAYYKEFYANPAGHPPRDLERALQKGEIVLYYDLNKVFNPVSRRQVRIERLTPAIIRTSTLTAASDVSTSDHIFWVHFLGGAAAAASGAATLASGVSVYVKDHFIDIRGGAMGLGPVGGAILLTIVGGALFAGGVSAALSAVEDSLNDLKSKKEKAEKASATNGGSGEVVTTITISDEEAEADADTADADDAEQESDIVFTDEEAEEDLEAVGGLPNPDSDAGFGRTFPPGTIKIIGHGPASGRPFDKRWLGIPNPDGDNPGGPAGIKWVVAPIYMARPEYRTAAGLELAELTDIVGFISFGLVRDI